MATNTFTGASAVPFNSNTQTFGATPSVSMGNVNLNTGNSTPTQNTQVTPIQPTNIPNSQNLSTLTTQPITLPTQKVTQTQPVMNYAALGMQPVATPYSEAQNSISSTMLQLIPQLSGQSQEKITQEANRNIPQMNQQLQDLSNQIIQKNAELNQADVSLALGLQNVEDQAIPMEFITGQQASLEKRAKLAKAVKISNINMLNATAQSLQGNISLAQKTAQDAVDLKYAPIKDMYNTLQAQLQAIQPLADAEELKVIAQQSAMYDLQKTLITQKQNRETKFMDMLMKAPTDYGATPDQISRAISIYNQTGDPIQAFAGVTGADGYIQSYNIQNGARNTSYNAVGDLTVENGYDLNAFKKGIAGVESSNNYNAIGPATKSGDKAYGKYQVMGSNIPSWTKQALGYSMTPQQFLASPDAQEKVFENQSLANYAKYGNWDDVASVWFSGRPLTGNVSSDGYNTVPQYVSKVRTAMGVPAQPTIFSQVTNPTVKYWSDYLKANPTKSIKEVPANLQTLVIAYDNQNIQNDPKTQDVVEKINQIDAIMNSPALSSVVGSNFLSRGTFGNVATGALAGAGIGAYGGTVVGTAVPIVGNIIGGIGGGILGGIAGGLAGGATTPQFSGQAQNFISNVEQLSNQEFINKLINAKAQGATFGALNEQEGTALRNASTRLNNWAIKDSSGKVVGYDIDEASFLQELNKIKTLAQKGIAKAGGNILGGTVTDVYYQNIIPQVAGTTTNNSYGYQF